MSRFTTQKDINEVVWRACDTFRGTIDPAQYKDYILVMLFLKFVSDLTREKREEYERRFGGDAVRVQRAMERERFIVPKGTDFYSLYAARNEPDIGDRINKALEKLEDANKAKLEGVFRAIDFNSEAALGETKERNARLKHLLEDFADPRLDLRPTHLENQDVLGDAYEFLVKNFASDSGRRVASSIPRRRFPVFWPASSSRSRVSGSATRAAARARSSSAPARWCPRGPAGSGTWPSSARS